MSCSHLHFSLKLCIMKLSRHTFFSFLLVFALLFAQQGGIEHTLLHALENNTQPQKQSKQEQQMPHSKFCAQCAAYTQSGTALSGLTSLDVLPAIQASVERRYHTTFYSTSPQAAFARGPPALFHKIA